MELKQEQLKEKALLLLRRERELFDLRMKHEQVTLWLNVTQNLPQLFADPRITIADAFARLRKTLIEGLRLQRTCFVEIDGQTLRPMLPTGPPRSIGPEALALMEREPAGFCNDPSDPTAGPLAEALGLGRFIWSRIDVPGRGPVLLAAGFDRSKAKFQSAFDVGDPAHLRNATLQAQGHLRNALLVQELELERENLEQRVKERTEELDRRNRDMRLVLDNVAQALLTINGAGQLANERSASVDRWFGAYEGSPRFVEYIAKVDSHFAEIFALAHEAFIEEVLPVEICLKQLPGRLRAHGRTFHCTYRPITDAADGKGLLIVIDDVTEQMRLAQEEAEQSELLAVFQGLTRDRDGFLAFFEEASRLVEELTRDSPDEMNRIRHLHTLKGSAAMMGAKVVADLCHRAEDELSIEGGAASETLRQLEERWATVKQTVELVIGERAQGVVEIPLPSFDLLCEEIHRVAPPIVHRLMRFKLEPVGRPLARLSQYAQSLAYRMGKGELTITIEASGTRLDPRRFGGLWSALVHVVRNAVDHGIESSAERLAQGKSGRGRLNLRATETAHELTIDVEDDGRGIDWACVRERAAARGMPGDSEADLAAAILSDGFSTCDKVTTTSGRGVGMAAVRQQVLNLGGTLSVKSEPGAGTLWRFTFPLSLAFDITSRLVLVP